MLLARIAAYNLRSVPANPAAPVAPEVHSGNANSFALLPRSPLSRFNARPTPLARFRRVLCGGDFAVWSRASFYCGGYCVRKFAVVFVLVSVFAVCQINYAFLGGTINDPQGKAFAGAEIELTSSSTHAVRSARSNDEGIFEITGLLPGDYELKVQAPGFSPLAQSLRLEVAQQMVLKLTPSSVAAVL